MGLLGHSVLIVETDGTEVFPRLRDEQSVLSRDSCYEQELTPEMRSLRMSV